MEFYPAIRVMRAVADPEAEKEIDNPNFRSPRMDDAYGQQTLQMAGSLDDLIISANNNTALSLKAKDSIKKAVLTICIDGDKKKELDKLKRIPMCSDALRGCDVPLHPDILHMLWAYIREIMKNQGFVVGSRFGFIGYSSPSNVLNYPYNTIVMNEQGEETEFVGAVLNDRSREISTNRKIREQLEALVYKNSI
jgi:hypothetical protein